MKPSQIQTNSNSFTGKTVPRTTTMEALSRVHNIKYHKAANDFVDFSKQAIAKNRECSLEGCFEVGKDIAKSIFKLGKTVFHKLVSRIIY